MIENMKNTEEIEEWRDIEGYENYQVSNLGRVKTLNYKGRGKERILKSIKSKNGYCFANLYKAGKLKTYYVHRLVASAFIENPNNYPMVNHRNEIKTDNRAENLEFCDVLYNNNYGTRNQRISKTNKGKTHTQETKDKMKGKKRTQETKDKIAKGHQKPILQLSENNELIKEWESAKQVERELNINQGNIIKCCKGKRKTCSGFHWKYVS